MVRIDDSDGTELRVFLGRMPTGPILALDGTAALIWDEAVRGDEDGLAGRVALRTGASIDDLRTIVTRFVEKLITERLLVRVADGKDGYQW